MTGIQPLNVTVMLGGFSREREISLQSGAAVAGALRELGHRASELDVRDENWILPEGTDVVFIALHGTYGEDGGVQTRLEALGVPFTGSDALSSRIAFDKIETKHRLVANGLPTAPFRVLEDSGQSFPSDWRFPVVLKPVREGSSVGLRFVEAGEDWNPALRETFEFGGAVLMEEKISGREITVGVLADRALPIVEIRPRQGGYDYHNKYTAGATDHFCPASFSEQTTQTLQRAALAAFRTLGCRDYGRVDIIVREDDRPVILEVNTLPGMTALSLFPEAAAATGIDFKHLCQKMTDLAMDRSAAGRAVA